MESFSQTKLPRMRVVDAFKTSGHPWVRLSDLQVEAGIAPGSSVELIDSEGESLGSGLFDPRDASRAWRRYSFADDVAFDERYLSTAINDALSRRGAEGCQRLIHSDADYLPGLIVEQYDQILTIVAETAAIDAQLPLIAEILKEACQPQEIVFLNHVDERKLFDLERSVSTLSGNNLKARWIELDGAYYRIDWMHPEKPGVYLDQREQQLLVGSLCEGRCVLDAYSHSGGFALQALRSSAEHVVAIDASETCVKAIGANAQRNECFIETIDCDAAAFLAERQMGDFDVIILDPPEGQTDHIEEMRALHVDAFKCLPSGGVLATYLRSSKTSLECFERLVGAAASLAGREGRIFARTGQPFDFPSLLNLPESSYLKGLILQVE